MASFLVQHNMTPSAVWLVTGASSGLGLAISVSALRAGHKVLACARTPEKAAKDHPEVESLGGKWLRLDVTSSDAQQIVQKAVEDEGRIDVLVNNAGYASVGSIEDLTMEELQGPMDSMCFGAIRVIRGVLPTMRAQRSGTIVNQSSVFAMSAPTCNVSYNAAKYAMEGVSDTLSKELACFNIRVIVIEAGLFLTNIGAAAHIPGNGFSKTYSESPPYVKFMEVLGRLMKDPEEEHTGDPEKLGARVVEYVNGTGMAKEVDPKFVRLPLGPDAIQLCKRKAKELTDNFDAMEKIALSTNFDRHGHKVAEFTTR